MRDLVLEGDTERHLLPSEKLLALRHAFEAGQIPYAFRGAIAVFSYRDPRSTTDIDINVFLSPDRQAEVLSVLGELFAVDAPELGAEIEANGQARADIAAVAAAQGGALDGPYLEAALELFVEASDHRFARWRELTGGGR